MPPAELIDCPGCDIIVDAARACCPGCGRCLGCGDRRGRGEENCPKCSVPYCTHCGKCAVCGDLRFTTIAEPCRICGHPNVPKNLEKLIRSQGISARAERASWKLW